MLGRYFLYWISPYAVLTLDAYLSPAGGFFFASMLLVALPAIAFSLCAALVCSAIVYKTRENPVYAPTIRFISLAFLSMLIVFHVVFGVITINDHLHLVAF